MSAAPDTAAELRRQLLACARLFEVVAEQVDAAAEDDRERAAAIAPDRALAERALRAATVECEPHVPPDPAVEVARAMQHGLDFIEGRSEDQQRLRDWIEVLQQASLPLMRDLVIRPRRVAGQV